MSRITQKGQGAPLAISANGAFQNSTDQNLATLVGSRFDLADGHEVMLVSVGATALATAGLIVQDAAVVPNHQNIAVTAYTAYSANGNTPASCVVTLGATAMTANQYQGGYAIVNAGPGIGSTLKIASHTGGLASSTLPVIVFEEAPGVALTTSSKLCLTAPHGANVVINPTTPTGAVAGVTLYPLAAGIAAGATTGTPSFGFVGTKGVYSVLSDALVASVGQNVAPSITTVGATCVGTGTNATIGYASQTAVSAESRGVFLNI